MLFFAIYLTVGLAYFYRYRSIFFKQRKWPEGNFLNCTREPQTPKLPALQKCPPGCSSEDSPEGHPVLRVERDRGHGYGQLLLSVLRGDEPVLGQDPRQGQLGLQLGKPHACRKSNPTHYQIDFRRFTSSDSHQLLKLRFPFSNM